MFFSETRCIIRTPAAGSLFLVKIVRIVFEILRYIRTARYVTVRYVKHNVEILEHT